MRWILRIRRKFISALVLSIALFSSGAVIIHECHSDSTKNNVVATSSVDNVLHSEHLAPIGDLVEIMANSNIVEAACTVLFIIVLLAIRRFLLALIRVKANIDLLDSRIIRESHLFQNLIAHFHSIFQLGVIRI